MVRPQIPRIAPNTQNTPQIPRIPSQHYGSGCPRECGFHHIGPNVGEARVGADVRVGIGVGGRDGEGHAISPEEKRHRLRGRGYERVCPGAMIGIVRRIDERLPVGIADSFGIAVTVPFVDGGDGPPRREEDFIGPSIDESVGGSEPG